MTSVVNVLLPIFGLILAGYLGRRTGVLGETAAAELNRFVVWLCLPSLLFQATATASWQAFWHPGFIVVNVLACIGVFALTIAWRCLSGQPGIDATIDGLATGYANVGYVGIPLCVLVLGDAGLTPALIATLIVVCVLFALAIVIIEVLRQAGGGIWRPMMTVAVALSKNPIVLAPVIGGLWATTGLAVWPPLGKFVDLMGTATTPCALVSIGAFIARPVRRTTSSSRGLGGLVALKLLAHPLLTAVLAFWVFDLSTLWATAAVLLAALPTGTGPYMLADFYGRDLTMTARVILTTTIGSLVTLSLCLIGLQHMPAIRATIDGLLGG